MDCGVPFCQSRQRLPDRQPDPRVERPGLSGPLARRARPAAQDQQLPGVHRPHLPRAVRRRVRARHHRSRRSRSRTSRTRSSTAASPKAGSRRTLPATRTGKRVAIVGSGPAGLAAARQLNKAGHTVTVYERADRIGGLLMYGIPNMKLDKGVVERRVDLLRAEGVEFVINADVGKQRRSPSEAARRARRGAARDRRDAAARPARFRAASSRGIHFAMEFLTRQHEEPARLAASPTASYISAEGQATSIVIGGGDTGADCIGTSLRHGCKSLVNFELLDQAAGEARRRQPLAAVAEDPSHRLRARGSRSRASAPIRATTPS